MTPDIRFRAVVDSIARPGVPVPGLAHSPWINDSALVIQGNQLVFGEVFEVDDYRFAVNLAADEGDVGVPNETIVGL